MQLQLQLQLQVLSNSNKGSLTAKSAGVAATASVEGLPNQNLGSFLGTTVDPVITIAAYVFNIFPFAGILILNNLSPYIRGLWL